MVLRACSKAVKPARTFEGGTTVSEAQPPQPTPNASSPLRKAAASINALNRMTRIIIWLEISIVAIGGIAGGSLLSLAFVTGNIFLLSYLYGVLLFMGAGFILFGIGSFIWPAPPRDERRIPQIHYAGMICMGAAICLQGLSQVVAFLPIGNLFLWSQGPFYLAVGLMLIDLLPMRRRGRS